MKIITMLGTEYIISRDEMAYSINHILSVKLEYYLDSEKDTKGYGYNFRMINNDYFWSPQFETKEEAQKWFRDIEELSL